MLPRWWGILLAERLPGGLKIKTIRRAKSNPRRNPQALVELLWLEDALALLEDRGLARGLRGKPRWVLWERICHQLEINEIAAAVRASLKARTEKRLPAPPMKYDGCFPASATPPRIPILTRHLQRS